MILNHVTLLPVDLVKRSYKADALAEAAAGFDAVAFHTSTLGIAPLASRLVLKQPTYSLPL